MSSRLQSLSTPSRRARASASPSPSPSAASPARPVETTTHRMLRLVLAEVRTVLGTWDDIILIDGLKAAKSCIDQGTEMDNILLLPDGPERPRVSPHLEALRDAQATLRASLAKLDKLLFKLNALIDQAEKLLFDACKSQSFDFALTEPFWVSWTLDDFVNSLPPLLTVHNAEHAELTRLSTIILWAGTKFEDARTALERWRDLGRGGERWEAAREWEELVALETGSADEDEGGKRRKGKR